MIAEERETTIAYSDADDVVRVFTCLKRDLTAIKKNKAFKQVDGGVYRDGTEWGSFHLPMDKFGSVSSIVKRTRTMTDEQRVATAERLANARKARNGNS